MNKLSPLEAAAGAAIAAQIDIDGDTKLLAQLLTARITSRDFTGVGFFTEFDVDRTLPPSNVKESPGGWIRSLVGPKHYPLEFMLYVREGFAHMIEAYSYGDGFGDLDFLTCDFTCPETVERQAPPLS